MTDQTRWGIDQVQVKNKAVKYQKDLVSRAMEHVVKMDESGITDHELRTWKHKFLKRLDMYHELIYDEKEKAKVSVTAGDFTRNELDSK